MLLVRLLGSVDVVGDDGSVRHSVSALRRTLMALLAIRPGRVVAPDWLLEHVWGDKQPDSGLRALRFHVSQLRKELGDAVSIETKPGGYRLVVARDSVDALIFEEQTRVARIETDDQRAADLVRQRWGCGAVRRSVTLPGVRRSMMRRHDSKSSDRRSSSTFTFGGLLPAPGVSDRRSVTTGAGTSVA